MTQYSSFRWMRFCRGHEMILVKSNNFKREMGNQSRMDREIIDVNYIVNLRVIQDTDPHFSQIELKDYFEL